MKYSKQRNAILKIVKDRFDHPGAEDVYREVKKQMPDIGLATVYRNLHLLKEQGLIRSIPQGNGAERFDGRTEDHFHAICRSCGKLIDLYPADAQAISKLRREMRKAFGIEDERAMELLPVLMEVTCADCAAEARSKQTESDEDRTVCAAERG